MTDAALAHPDPRALAGRVLSDAGLEAGSLTVARGDVDQLVARAFGFGVTAGVADVAGDRACRICGCTQYRACPGGCFWVSHDLCSTCRPFVEAL